MENKELVELAKEKKIAFKSGVVNFKGYTALKQNAINLSNKIKSLYVDEESVAAVKKELAAVNKDVKFLEDIRISIKKEMLVSYNEFEAQIKEIVNIVKDADSVVREQVKELEEAEREKKTNVIKELFDSKLQFYEFKSIITFENYFKPNMANKTTSINKLEIDMSEWLEYRKSEFIMISKNYTDDRDLILDEWVSNGFNVANAINKIIEDKKRIEELKTKVDTVVESKVNKMFIYILNDEKDCKLIEMFMNQNNVIFRKEVK